MKRRDFLTKSSILGASMPLGVSAPMFLTSCSGDSNSNSSSKKHTPEELGMYSFVDIAPDGKPLKAALVGCGDRGTGAATNFLSAGTNISIVALAFDSYKKIMEMSDIDLVLLCTPTHFRPEHFKVAIEASKHVFMEKPCAVDPVGMRTVIAASKVVTSKGLTVVTGNQRRHQRDHWEAYVQVRNGLIGEVVSATSHWNQGAWWNKKQRPEWSEMEYCLRNWFNIKWLSGDHILDQGIHNIDVATWFIGQVPERAVGFGGRVRRLIGDIFDFFSVYYYYPKNKRMPTYCTTD